MRWFDRLAQRASTAAGHWSTFIVAALLVIVWAPSLPLFGDVDTWQLVINTTTTIVTFLMVFLLANAQNRSDRAMHAKLDSIIGALDQADDSLRRIEGASEDEIEAQRDA